MKQMICGIMRDLEAESIAYRSKCDAIRLAAEGLRRNEIGRICARYELESDEFYTAEEKASSILRGERIFA